MRSALERLLADPAERARMGAAAARTRSGQTVEQQAKRVLAVYRKALSAA